MAETITAEMIIHDVVTKHPETVKVFHGHGLPCTACAVGSRESIAGGTRTHRFTPEKQSLLLQDLNAAMLPILLVFIILLVNNRRLMGRHVNKLGFNIIAWITVVVITMLIVLLLLSTIFNITL